MTISYKWLSEYLPEEIEPQKLSNILTSIGLEVESVEKFESIKGGLEGVVTGLVLEVAQHTNADKLKLTKVDVGLGEPLKIVCGAANVAVGQKVLVATVGSTVYPIGGQPIAIKAAKIRGEESQGMICAEDEIGLGTSHEGILVLPEDVAVGTKASDYYKPYTDHVFEIGLTPNRMDAMSHLGVAKDVCAYLTHHNKQEAWPKSPFTNDFKTDNNSLPIKVSIENTEACKRYAGVTISGVTVKESPKWLQDKLVSIGQRPINNIVDITNFILHETGQPLHAFDAAGIKGGAIIVTNLPRDAKFVTLDEKERRLDSTDLMICNSEDPMCIAGVFGGAESGVKNNTKNIFLESAWFNPTTIRKTSFRHGLRTEAAARFEKGVDISNVVNVLKRAALLIKQVAGGEISSDIVDVYPAPQQKTQVGITYHYLKKLSGKNYHPDAVKRILTSLGFEILKEGMDELWVLVPYSKPDISLPADIVEEILRIDGLDNVEITGSMTIAPAVDENIFKENLREKISGYLVGLGFNEIVTNSITNSRYYNETELAGAAKMINSLSVDLDVMRLSMVETGLETISYNINRKNKNLQLFEFGKTYHAAAVGHYQENEHLCLYITGQQHPDTWKSKQSAADFFYAKGIAAGIVKICGLETPRFENVLINGYSLALSATHLGAQLVTVGEIDATKLKTFDIKQPVFCIDFDLLLLLKLTANQTITYKEVSRFPGVQRDLALVVNRNVTFEAVENVVRKTKVSKLQNLQLFDIFESEKLGYEKKSLAVSFTFLDEEKTLTDKEIDELMNRLVQSFENDLGAEIRK
ncbi:phenylalanine--tRNA ligase subunit beta [Segetibacter sp.]|jgi:phenylalanyl-tRNA synthetase beta chain|uniref:phenylalanine--tRNA ligase subunit beta n=1 Tax=Segetibacter sp. TaxID=2231182 RepID=UPI00260D3340|nr:phenylalanine--tRNA ligase subunit beta [Segetibacter sp.]MCW3082034.1 phenylalanyl-tRNA synthetase beta chain [Segetibacter sp.]